MELEFAFETDWRAWSYGYCREFLKLGMTSLVVGPVHIQFACDLDRVEEFSDAMRSPWLAFRTIVAQRRRALWTWAAERFAGRVAETPSALPAMN